LRILGHMEPHLGEGEVVGGQRNEHTDMDDGNTKTRNLDLHYYHRVTMGWLSQKAGLPTLYIFYVFKCDSINKMISSSITVQTKTMAWAPSSEDVHSMHCKLPYLSFVLPIATRSSGCTRGRSETELTEELTAT